MNSSAISASILEVMQREMRSTFTAAYGRQEALLNNIDSFDTFTFQTRGRFSSDAIETLLRSVSEIAHPFGRSGDSATAAVIEESDINHGWLSYRAAATAPTDGDVALAISWRFTIPYRDTLIDEIDNLWAHPVGAPITVPPPLAEAEPITNGDVALHVGPSTTTWMKDGHFRVAELENILKPRVHTHGGIELLSEAEVALLTKILQALVNQDRAVLDAIGAYEHGHDPYMWTQDYGAFGEVHFVLPPGPASGWEIDVQQVDDEPGSSFLIVDMWTAEEGRSDLSLEINLHTDLTGSLRGEFINLHVM